jgi:hypothetical protein
LGHHAGVEDDWLSVPAAARRIGISYQTVYRLVRSGSQHVVSASGGMSRRLTLTPLSGVVRIGLRATGIAAKARAAAARNEGVDATMRSAGGAPLQSASAKRDSELSCVVPTACRARLAAQFLASKHCEDYVWWTEVAMS